MPPEFPNKRWIQRFVKRHNSDISAQKPPISDGRKVEHSTEERDLLVETQANQSVEEVKKTGGTGGEPPSPPSTIMRHHAAVAEETGEADRDSQRRLELLEIKMERELAEQRRHADEQVREFERLQRVQLEARQNQHAQLLATIQQQQAMMLDLIKSVAAQAKNKE
ncbi:hypothetical protein KRP22_007153 [Phytophthora ramorum]|nr:hypothetical protein KRP22_1750 [Phytophthora ramorum]